MNCNRNILLAVGNHKERTSLAELLESWDYRVTSAFDGTDAAGKLGADTYRLLLLEHEIPGLSSRDLLQKAKATDEAMAVVFLSGRPSVEHAVEAIKAGATDFWLKNMAPEQLKLHLNRIFSDPPPLPDLAGEAAGGAAPIVTCNPAMQKLLELARQVADSRASVLIQGESGTGKELFARYLHDHSSRCDKPFVGINCGALPETLLESELFGHEKGAFTGALAKKPGKFELADGGTILLDEVTEMQPHLQTKLLRVLQERMVDRVGGTEPVEVDVRVIATTNRNLQEAIRKGDFREDLYYRLNVVPLVVPPLRERRDDIPHLARHFIAKYNRLDGRNVKNLTTGALERLNALPLQGNVRELENIIERAVLLAKGDYITEQDLFLENMMPIQNAGSPSPPPEPQSPPESFSGSLKEIERKIIFQTLDKTEGNRTHAAQILGISVRTLRNKLNEYKESMEAI